MTTLFYLFLIITIYNINVNITMIIHVVVVNIEIAIYKYFVMGGHDVVFFTIYIFLEIALYLQFCLMCFCFTPRMLEELFCFHLITLIFVILQLLKPNPSCRVVLMCVGLQSDI